MSALRVLAGRAPRESDSGAGLARVGACLFGVRASAEAEGGNRARGVSPPRLVLRNPFRPGGRHAPVSAPSAAGPAGPERALRPPARSARHINLIMRCQPFSISIATVPHRDF